ncbi:hypothetical protein GCM10010211_46500 [Streptomyces albospinus]|uniref:Uncharacterized protein n=1 Tax=Streptomyces albospinus TaxID=285515 RepID=A0ABQ2VBB6_9ACTN|nr:hypothetical protein GCM10010211_46500 [Streptomyces albospinus]
MDDADFLGSGSNRTVWRITLRHIARNPDPESRFPEGLCPFEQVRAYPGTAQAATGRHGERRARLTPGDPDGGARGRAAAVDGAVCGGARITRSMQSGGNPAVERASR